MDFDKWWDANRESIYRHCGLASVIPLRLLFKDAFMAGIDFTINAPPEPVVQADAEPEPTFEDTQNEIFSFTFGAIDH